MSRSCQSRSCCLLDVLEIVIDLVMNPTFHMTMSHNADNMAKLIGCSCPFPNAEVLPKDTGDQFFSLHMETLKDIGKRRGDAGECLCKLRHNPTSPTRAEKSSTTTQPQNENRNIAQSNNTQPSPPRATMPKPPEPPSNGPNAIAHRNGAPAAIATTMSQMNSPMIAPHQTPQLLPMWCFPPAFAAAAPPACCFKCKEWQMRQHRAGGPRHHPLCNR